MHKYLLLLFIVVFLGLSNLSFAQQDALIGKWKTIDDETHEPKSIVKIYMKDGEFFGRIDSLFRKPGEDPNPICDKCPDDDPRKNQPVKGMVIIKNMVKKGNEYKGGTILDPKKGKIYRCKLWIENGNLKVRGYIAFFYRTQTWFRVK